jgi:hypothetical protein
MSAMLKEMPDEVVDLFFEYAKDLDRSKVEGEANDAEVAKAFSQVIEIAFPLFTSLATTMEKLGR